jgi:EAL domain-containing protein (putative c-di-GMP-specific phosphodiesterase class I)
MLLRNRFRISAAASTDVSTSGDAGSGVAGSGHPSLGHPGLGQPGLGQPTRSESRRHNGGDDGRLLDEIIREQLVTVDFHSIVDVVCRQVVGFEALSRGPEGPLRSPAALFAAARAENRAGELDWICRAVAFRMFMRADLHPTISLFVNVERDSLVTPCPEQVLPDIREAERRLRVFIDLEGKAIARYPREVFETVRHARAAHWGVSMNDLEVSTAALALLPVLEPDVIRLDRQAQSAGLHRGRLALFAALAEAEQTGAALLTDHIEDEDAEAMALTSGTRYTQGYFYGAPNGLPATLPTPKLPLRILQHPMELDSPFAIAKESGATTTSAPVTMRGVRSLIGDFVGIVDNADNPAFVGVVTAEGSEIGVAAQVFSRALADKSALHLVMGRNTSSFDDWTTHAVDLPAGHPFLDQICFVALSPHLATLLVFEAHDVGSPDVSTWDVAISQNPTVCRRVVRRLLAEADILGGGVLARETM